MLRGEKANLDGKHYQVKDAFNSPVPASLAHRAILMARAPCCAAR